MHPEAEGLLFPAVTPPLETPIGRNQAATADECISVSGLFSDRLLTRVDGAAANTGVLVRSCSEVPNRHRCEFRSIPRSFCLRPLVVEECGRQFRRPPGQSEVIV